MLKIIIWLFIRQISFFVKTRDLARVAVACLFGGILIALSIGAFSMGRFFVQYLTAFEQFFSPVAIATLEVLLAAVSILSLISFTIAYLKMFTEKHLSFFILSGASSAGTALSVFIRATIFGSWPYLIVSLPFFFGMTSGGTTSIVSSLIIFVLHFMLVLIVASIAGIIALLLHLLLGKRLARVLPMVFPFVLVGLFLLFTNIIYPGSGEKLFFTATSSQFEKTLKSLPIAYPLLPTTLFVESFFGNVSSIFTLFIQMFISFSAFYLLSKLFFRRVFMLSTEGYLVAGIGGTKMYRYPSPKISPGFSANHMRAFVEKEILSHKRTAGSLLYFSFIIFLAAIFVFFLSLTRRLDSSYTALLPLIFFASFFASFYLLLLVIIRFVFPVFAQEAPYLWSVITSFHIKSTISRAKWLFYQGALFLGVFLFWLILVSYYQVKDVPEVSVLLLLASFSIISCSLALYLGERFQWVLPKEDVEAIATTIPGIFFTIVSLFLGLILSILAFTGKEAFLSLPIFLVSVGIALTLFNLGEKRYQQSDI